MKTLVTGARGMLGTDLLPVLREAHEVIGVDVDDFDLTSPEAIGQVVRIAPDVVVNLAAFTDVDGCETHIDEAYAVNALAARNVALACQQCGAAMLHLSSDYVFDGEKPEPYYEWDSPNPLSAYGKTKLAGEYYVQHLLDHFYIVRTAWLYGRRGKNFVETILKAARETGDLQVVNDQQGSPTYTRDLAQALALLVPSGLFGIYHVTNSGACTWYGYTLRILALAGMKHAVVRPTDSAAYVRPARRPKNSRLHDFVWRRAFREPLRHWEEGLKDYLRETGKLA
jgi:dTDP-4-dehydrorhamnose reductase